MFGGLLRLYALADHREIKSQIMHLPQYRECQLWLADRMSSERLRKELEDLIAKLAFFGEDATKSDRWDTRSREEFENRRLDRIRKISMAASELGKWFSKLGQSYHAVRLVMQSTDPIWKSSIDDIHQQLNDFFRPKFMTYVPWPWLKELPRYLQAIHHRIGRLKTAGVAQDSLLMDKVNVYARDLQKRLETANHSVIRVKDEDTGDTLWPAGKLAEYRWMIEEYRVSLFAQQLGTRISVSPKRLDKLREECDSMLN
jgi:ATP-dependent helicase HrpA